MFTLFKVFAYFKQINNLHVITINYFVAIILGLTISPISVQEIKWNETWVLIAFILGFLFLLNFLLMAKTTAKIGLNTNTLANKMSLLIPVFVGVLFLKEELTTNKVLGICIAFPAIFLSIIKEENKLNVPRQFILLPILVFFISGINDTIIGISERLLLKENQTILFICLCFFSAFIIGSVLSIKQKKTIHKQSIIAGIALGIINYLTVHFLMAAIAETNQSAITFTVINTAVLAGVMLIGHFIFKEHLSIINWLGFILAIFSIFLITL